MKRIITPAPKPLRLGVSAFALTGYMLLFAPIYSLAGQIAGAVVFIPTILIAWFYGLRGGLVFALASVVLSSGLYGWVGDKQALDPLPMALGGLSALLVGLVVGGMRQTLDLLYRQSQELEQQQRALLQQVAQRKQIERELQIANNSLEQTVSERTAKLFKLNKQLEQELAERKRTEDQLIHNGLHDQVTGLANRKLFFDRLGRALERGKRRPDYRFGILYLDLDRFKVVNDSLGHAIGDQLLLESGRRLESCLRTVDTVARLGGDEFAILLEEMDAQDSITAISERILHVLGEPYELQGRMTVISASIGVVEDPRHYATPEDIVRDADTAMYCAKTLGRGRAIVFDETMHERVEAQQALESDLREAVEHQEFRVLYQPIVALSSERIVGFEALVRWQHPKRGLVMPSEFISIAEETGLIIPIGRFVLRTACRQLAEWQRRFPDHPALTIAVNMSAMEFIQPDLIAHIKQVLAETGLNASSLQLEITETMILDDTTTTTSRMAELRDLGIRVEIDDFGTGYSALGYLAQYPIDTIKIDRSFVQKIGINGNGAGITRNIVSLAHDLGMQVIAEGVETKEQMDQLQQLECEYAQGYLFARAVDASGIAQLLNPDYAPEPVRELRIQGAVCLT